jgi:hypothetical protein
MATIDQFASYLEGGGARANQFRVTFTSPVPAGNGLTVTKSSILCKAASLPGQTITEIPVNYRGRILYVAGDRTFETWTTTIVNDTDFQARNAVEGWMSAINDLESNQGLVRPRTYVADLIVEQLDASERVRKSYVMRNCWPTTINAIELNMDTVSAIEEFEITWRYTHFSASSV